jgi:hypothetical protein
MDKPTIRTSFHPDEIEWGEPLLPRVVDVEPLEGYRLRLLFNSGEERIFDATYLIGRGVFEPLRDPAVFAEAWVEAGSIEWPSGAGLSYNTLYLKSTPVEGAPGEK